MRKEDLKEMAVRCRFIAGTADEFTKRRLLDLASKFEARITSRPRAGADLTATAIAAIKIDPNSQSGER